MTVKSINLWLILGVALLWQPLSANAFIYSAQAIEGWVVDAGTDKPIEGVIVVAHWQLKGGFEGGNPVGELKIIETVTDQNGRYYFPSWGPKFAWSGHLKSESPEILMFKLGYKYLGLSNRWYRDRDTSKSDWNGKTVKLEPFRGTLAQYAQHLWSLNNDLWTVGYDVGNHSGDFCGWKSFPNMLRAMDKLAEELKPLRLMERTVTASLRAADAQLRAADCGTVADLLGK
jgi:hypothetical protein